MPNLDDIEQQLQAIHGASEGSLQIHFNAILTEFKKSAITSVELKKVAENTAEIFKRKNEEIEVERRKIIKLEKKNAELQAALEDAKKAKHECVSCKKQCFKYCVACMK